MGKKPQVTFNPNAAAAENSGVFGLPFTAKEAKLVFIPVPWEATTSYGGGTSRGPQSIFDASHQVDLYDLELGRPYEAGMAWVKRTSSVATWNKEAKNLARKKRSNVKAIARVNALGAQLNKWVYAETKKWLTQNKIVAIVGGDHSVPFGALQALGDVHSDGYGILHFDAHSDTRKAYEGFTWSHASIMYNVLTKIPAIQKLVQVGIRDFCEEEWQFLKSQGTRADVFFDEHLAQRKYRGDSWAQITTDIIEKLPQKVWISFDIDGLDPRFCPHTGTPVPGGLDFQEALYIIKALARSGRTIVGFDLNEVAPGPQGDTWDANVGARLLYKLAGWTLKSQGLYK